MKTYTPLATPTSMDDPVTLSNGLILTHQRAANGSSEVLTPDDRPMTEAEWHEYCLRIRVRALVLEAERIES